MDHLRKAKYLRLFLSLALLLSACISFKRPDSPRSNTGPLPTASKTQNVLPITGQTAAPLTSPVPGQSTNPAPNLTPSLALLGQLNQTATAISQKGQSAATNPVTPQASSPIPSATAAVQPSISVTDQAAPTPASTMTGMATAAVGRVGQSVSNGPLPVNGQPASVTVIDQPIHNGLVIIPKIFSLGNMWLVIHPQYPDGTLANFIGYSLLHDGLNTNVRVPVDTSRTRVTLVAMLHINQSQANVPQYPGVDAPYMLNNEMVAPAFKVQGPLSGDVLLTNSKESGTLHLADGYGMSLYINSKDQPGVSTCNTGECLGNFRPLLATGAFHAENGISINKIGAMRLPDGTKQVTYGGAPLYYNVEDIRPSDTFGQGVNGVWELVTP